MRLAFLLSVCCMCSVVSASAAADGDGRDHNHWGFTTWLAGGGARGGMANGATDEFGFRAVTD